MLRYFIRTSGFPFIILLFRIVKVEAFTTSTFVSHVKNRKNNY